MAILVALHGHVGLRRYGFANVPHPDGAAIAISNDDVVERRGVDDLIVRCNGEAFVFFVDRTLCGNRRRRYQGAADVFQGHAGRSELRGIDLDADRRLLFAAELALRDAADLGNLLREEIIHIIVDDIERQRLGARRQDHYRRIGGIHLLIAGRRRHLLRQRPAGGRNRGLNVLRRGVDVAIEIELNRNRGSVERTHRGQLRDPGNLPELALQRRRNGCRHGLGARTLQRCIHPNGGKIHLRQRCNRQERERDQPHEGDRGHQQGGRDRAADKWLGYVHARSRFARDGLGAPTATARILAEFALAVDHNPLVPLTIARRIKSSSRSPARLSPKAGREQSYSNAPGLFRYLFAIASALM